jgi:putative nucleotidyltransferase with HDIG domain
VLGAVRAALARQVAGLGRPAAAARLLAGLDARLVVPDQFLDGPATDAADAAARQAVPPVVVAAGQVIVRQGQRVTAGDLVRLREAGLLPFGGRYGVVATSLLLAAFVAALALAFLGRVQRRASGGERELLLFGAVFCGTTAAVRFSAPLSPFLAPVTWAALLVAIAFGPPSAVFTAALGGLVAGLLDHSLAVALVATASAWTGVFALRRPEQRTDLLRAGLWAALGGAAIAFLVGVFGGQDPAALAGLTGGSGVQGWQAAGAAALSGFLSGALAVGTLPLLEALGVLTPFRLLELCNPAQPLLRRLMLEAPGTYHHSLMVANLAEAACEAVGGDALLARAGAYYHDVGKVKRPYFFVENQFGGVNPHEGLSPQLSALVIRSHVRDGVELAQQARLPAAVVDFIRTHHARTRVGFFQQQAMAAQAPAEEAEAGAGSRPAVTRGGSAAAPEAPAPAPTAGGSPADEEDPFRYPGPLPETRETAVVMLADAVEAAVRASGGRSDEQIRATVDRVVATRLAEGQLDRAELTLRDVDRIKATFRRILAGAYHARIEYPSELQASAAGRPGAARGGRVLPLPGRGGGAAGPRHGHGARG